MPWVWLAGVGTPVDGLQAYQPRQPADPLAVDLVSVISEPGGRTRPGSLLMLDPLLRAVVGPAANEDRRRTQLLRKGQSKIRPRPRL